MPVYFVATITIDDRSEYSNYEAGFGAAFAKYPGKILSVSDAPELVEGEWEHSRTVLLEFPDRQQAMAWYESPDYQAILPHRHAASKADIVMVDGFGS